MVLTREAAKLHAAHLPSLVVYGLLRSSTNSTCGCTHLGQGHFKGGPKEAVTKPRCFQVLYTKEGPLSCFAYIKDYPMLLAGKNGSSS